MLVPHPVLLAAPTFRSLVTADLPAGVGSVTSVALTLTGSALLTLAVGGSPITTSGTLALTVNFANQAAHTFLAGPASGGSGPVTARAMVPADFAGRGFLQLSPRLRYFDASAGTSFSITLTWKCDFQFVTNPTAGEIITFIITEDGTGGSHSHGRRISKARPISKPDANGVNVQSFIYDEVTGMWRAIGPGSWNAS